MECHFASYSRERSLKFWQDKKATPLIDRYLGGGPHRYEYAADLAIAEELNALAPQLTTTLSTVAIDPNWGRPQAVVMALCDDPVPNLDNFLDCKKYLTESQYESLLQIKTKRDKAAQQIGEAAWEATKLEPRKISKREALHHIASIDLDVIAVTTEPDIPYTLLEHFVYYFNLTLQPDTELPTRDEIIRLFGSITPKTLQEISTKSRESVEDLLDFLKDLKPVVNDLKNYPDAEFLIIGDAIDPESFEDYLKKRSGEIFAAIEHSLPAHWTVGK